MKTNQIMKRPLGTFSVSQRTKDGMFNATDLLKQWNSLVGNNILDTQKIGYVKKDLDDFFNNKNTKEFIEALIEEENLHSGNLPYIKSKARADRGGGTWMHPILFVKFAMWLNPTFEVKVIKFVYDRMLEYRNEAGESYKELSGAMKRIVPSAFMPRAMAKIGEALNWCVFNAHEKELRNKHGDEKKQMELFTFTRKVAALINEGFLRSYDDVLAYLRKQYFIMNSPKVFKK